jgi:predicted DNA-binding transcriptional regulator AlpA
MSSLFDPISNVSHQTDQSTHGALRHKEVLTVAEAAAFLRLKKTTLALYRRLRKGPSFVRLSRSRVVYRKADLESWLEARAISLTQN